jgi:hypothetical protein
MSQQQGQYLCLVNELSTEASLQLRGSEQKLITACQIFSSDCSILLLLSASALDSLVLAANWKLWFFWGFFLPGGLLSKQGPRRTRLRGAPPPHSHNALVADWKWPSRCCCRSDAAGPPVPAAGPRRTMHQRQLALQHACLQRFPVLVVQSWACARWHPSIPDAHINKTTPKGPTEPISVLMAIS